MSSNSNNAVAQQWKQAESYARQKQWHSALSAYEAVVEQQPTHALAMLRASRVALQLGNYESGHAWVMRALKQRPGGDDAVLMLARALRAFNESGALLECVEHSRWRERRSAVWLTDVSMLVSTVGDNELARQMLDLAIIRDPGYPPARYFRGVVAMFFGDMAAAERHLEACMEKAPEFAQAHWVLSRLQKQTPESNHVARLRAVLPRVPRGGDSETFMAFALHNELHDLGRHEESWKALELGCRGKRRLMPHDAVSARRMFRRLEDLCSAEFVQPVDATQESSFVPVFIVGMHRSGSTLLEQLLAGHPMVADGGETYDFSGQMRLSANYMSKGVLDAEMVRRASAVDYARLGQRYLDGCQWRARERPYLTEKLPSNFLNLGFIAKALPQARILHMVRDPLDTCFSNLRMMFSGANTFSYDQQELATWYGHYRQLMDHWHTVMPGRVLDVHYEELVADTGKVMRGVLDFCGIPWDDSVATLGRRGDDAGAVSTASSPQMRSGIDRGRGAAWVPYEEQLGPLIDGLRPFRPSS